MNKIVFAQYCSKNGSIKHEFAAYRKFSYFGEFHTSGKFWYHKVDGWCMSISFDHGMSEAQMVKSFEAEAMNRYGCKVIWVDASKMAYKTDNGIKIK